MCSYLTRMMAYCVDNREDMVHFFPVKLDI